MFCNEKVIKSIGCSAAVHETKLIRNLLTNYDKDARPVQNNSDSVKVELQMIYKELKEIVSKTRRRFFYRVVVHSL